MINRSHDVAVITDIQQRETRNEGYFLHRSITGLLCADNRLSPKPRSPLPRAFSRRSDSKTNECIRCRDEARMKGEDEAMIFGKVKFETPGTYLVKTLALHYNWEQVKWNS